jgi:hypothetical protein
VIFSIPFPPVFPATAARPTRRDENSIFIGELEEGVVQELSFQP